MASSQNHSGICLERLNKTMRDLNRDIWSPARDFNPGLPEYIPLSHVCVGLLGNERADIISCNLYVL
jgi:hypothetical protein